jgi:ATP-dependent Clp protease ATP-binding subunit ClpA
MEAIRRLFTPEFRNRLDAVIQFCAVSTALTIERVVDKLIVEVEMQLEQKGVHAQSSKTTARQLDRREGLRPEDGGAPDGARRSRSTSSGRWRKELLVRAPGRAAGSVQCHPCR